MSDLGLFMRRGFGWAFASLGIAQKQTRMWSCLLWASLSLLHWSFGVSAHFSRQAPSRQELWPPPGLILIYAADTLDQTSRPSRHGRKHLGKVQEETLCRFEVEELSQLLWLPMA